MSFKKPSDYDDVRVGDYKVLSAGGYVCRILKAEETKSSKGKDMIKVAFDICEGEFKGYFKEQFDAWKAGADDPKSVKWPFSGTKWILIYDAEGGTNKDFKAFCTAVEESGAIVWGKGGDFLTANLKDAKVGIVFRREEHEYMNQTSWRTVPFRFRSVEAIRSGNYTVPDDKPLIKQADFDAVVDTFSAAEDDIPF